MEKKIKILGEEIVLRFNMAVQLAYEEITGEAFTLSGISGQKGQVALFIAAIVTNNPDCKITLERLVTEAKADDIKAMDTAMGELISDWYNLPKMVKDTIEEDASKAEKRKRSQKGKEKTKKH